VTEPAAQFVGNALSTSDEPIAAPALVLATTMRYVAVAPVAALIVGVVVDFVTLKLGKHVVEGGVFGADGVAADAIVELAPAVANHACGVAGKPACAAPLASRPATPPVTTIEGAPVPV